MAQFQSNLPLSKQVYYDLNLRNQVSEGTSARAVPLAFYESRGQPIVEQANKYSMSVVRFQCDSMSLPVFKAEIATGSTQSNVNLMIQNITLDYDAAGTITSIPATPLLFTQRDFYSPVPNAPSLNPPHYVQEQNTTYYDSYSYQHFVDILNTALQTSMTALIAAVGAALAGVDAPVAYWNSDSSKLEIRSRSDFFEEALTNKCRIHFSKSLYALFPNFDVIKNDYTIDNKKDYRIISRSYNGKNINSNFFGAFNGVVTTQEYSDLAALCPYGSLVFTSTSLPITPNILSAPYIFEDGHLTQVFSSIQNIQPIITDIATQDFSFRSNLLYIPSGQNRYINLHGNQPITKIDLQVWMLQKDGRLIPFFLHPNASCSVKFLFELIE